MMAMNTICRAIGQKSLAMNTRNLLTGHSSVVITGPSDRFNNNIRIGKTSAVMSRVIPMINFNGLEHSYMDIGKDLRRKFNFKDQADDALENALGTLRYSLRPDLVRFDVMIIDDAHLLLARDEKRPELSDISGDIWRGLHEAASSGRQFIFVSGHNPLKSPLSRLESRPGALELFFQAPILEYIRG